MVLVLEPAIWLLCDLKTYDSNNIPKLLPKTMLGTKQNCRLSKHGGNNGYNDVSPQCCIQFEVTYKVS
jgi:hypothetical protein